MIGLTCHYSFNGTQFANFDVWKCAVNVISTVSILKVVTILPSLMWFPIEEPPSTMLAGVEQDNHTIGEMIEHNVCISSTTLYNHSLTQHHVLYALSIIGIGFPFDCHSVYKAIRVDPDDRSVESHASPCRSMEPTWNSRRWPVTCSGDPNSPHGNDASCRTWANVTAKNRKSILRTKQWYKCATWVDLLYFRPRGCHSKLSHWLGWLSYVLCKFMRQMLR